MTRFPPSRLPAILAAAATAVLFASVSTSFAGSPAGDDPTPQPPGPAEGPTTAPATAPAPAPSPTTAPAVEPDSEALTLALAAENSLVKAFASVRESSVAVSNFQMKTPPGQKEPMELMAGGGSGVIFSTSGKTYVITNEHVIKDATKIMVTTFDGLQHVMILKDHVAQYDIALLEFKEPKPDPKGTEAEQKEAREDAKQLRDWVRTLKPAKIGNSRRVSSSNAAGLSEGDWVIATGNPFFLGSDGTCVATLGVISGLDRIIGGEFEYANAIQHDAEVNPGNSGGPLWTLDGELIGINGKIATRGDGASAGPSNTGASFSVPIHLIQRYLPALVDDRVKAAAGYLGLVCESAVDAKGQPAGAKVQRIAKDCPCARKGPDPKDLGLSVNDIIEKISVVSGSTATYEIKTASDFTNALALLLPGSRVRISFTHGPKKLAWIGEVTTSEGSK